MASAWTNGIDTGFVALGYAKVAVLGVVQGITELMPISSTAHLRIVPALFGWQDPGPAFSAAMQLAAVITYFWQDVRLGISSSAPWPQSPGATSPTARSSSLRLDADGRSLPRLQARRGGALLLPARLARHRPRRPEGTGGTAARRPRRAWLVGARRRLVVASLSAFVAIWGLMRILERFSGLALRRLPRLPSARYCSSASRPAGSVNQSLLRSPSKSDNAELRKIVRRPQPRRVRPIRTAAVCDCRRAVHQNAPGCSPRVAATGTVRKNIAGARQQT
jgi:hypothetical protein